MKKEDGSRSSPVRATIARVLPQAGYAVAYPSSENETLKMGTAITFSLSKWPEIKDPEKGQCVLLSDIKMFAKGWRAQNASPITPSSPN